MNNIIISKDFFADFLQSVWKVVDHYHRDEVRDYKSNPAPDHIVFALNQLQAVATVFGNRDEIHGSIR